MFPKNIISQHTLLISSSDNDFGHTIVGITVSLSRFFVNLSSPEDIPSSDRGDNTQQLTSLQQPQSSVKSSLRLHPAMKPSTLHKSKSLPSRYNDQKCSVKSNNLSYNKSKGPSVENIKPISAGRSNSNPQCYKGRLHSYQHSSKVKWSNSSLEYDLGSLSDSMSNVKSKVTWV